MEEASDRPEQDDGVTVGAVVAETLRQYGTEHFFLMTGGDNEFFFELRDRGISTVLARTERSAAFMADAYARLTKRAAFVYGQFGPGAAVVLSGLVDAGFAKSPVVALTSDTRTDVRHRFAYQELDQVGMFRPVTKWAVRVERADRAADLLRTAIREAVTGCPGPTYCGIPSDLLQEPVSADQAYADEHARSVPATRLSAEPAAINRAADIIAAATRPVILAGTGVIVSGAWDALVALAEQHDIPVVTSAGGKGAMAETHALCHGVAGRYSRRSANQVLRSADAVLAVGTRLNDMTTNRGQAVCARARLVHVDVDASCIGRNLKVDVPVVGDAREVLRQLASALPARYRVSEWAKTAAQITGEWLDTRRAVEKKVAGAPISPISVIAALRSALESDDLIVADTGYMAAWTSVLYDVRTPGLTHLRTAGSLGWALPGALGAQLAAPGRRVVAVIGDGGIGYHIADIETAVRLGLPVVIVLLNNGTLAYEYQIQSRLLGRTDSSLTDFANVDYAAVARAMGAGGLRVTNTDRLLRAVRDALADGGPVLIDVLTDREAMAPVTSYEHVEERLL